jgi:hypothetical protein
MRAHLCALSWAVVAAAADTSSSSTASSLRHAALTPPDSSGSRYYYGLHSDLAAPDVATRVIAGAGAGTLLRYMLQEAQEAANEVNTVFVVLLVLFEYPSMPSLCANNCMQFAAQACLFGSYQCTRT